MGLLDGKVAIVTGAGHGVGRGEALELAAAGAKVVVNDLADSKASSNSIDQAVEAFGRLDVIVNNAGILRDKMIFSMSEEEFDSVIRVHLKGTWCMTRHASAYWREQSKAGDQPRAAIVNTVSSSGLHGYATPSKYDATKCVIAARPTYTNHHAPRYCHDSHSSSRG